MQGLQIRQIWRILRQEFINDSKKFHWGVTLTPERFYFTLIQSKSVLAYCLEQIANQNTAVTRLHKDLYEMHRENSNIGRYSGHFSETPLGCISNPNSCAPPFPPKKYLKSTSNS